MAIHNLIESVEQRDNKLVYSIVVFTSDDGTIKQREEFVVNPPTPINLENQVASKTHEIENNIVDPSAFKSLLALQGTEIIVLPIQPPQPPNPPIPPTQEELDKIAYGEKVQKYKQFKGALSVGIKVQTELDAVTNDLVNDYIPGYEVFFTSPF